MGEIPVPKGCTYPLPPPIPGFPLFIPSFPDSVPPSSNGGRVCRTLASMKSRSLFPTVPPVLFLLAAALPSAWGGSWVPVLNTFRDALEHLEGFSCVVTF